jgi:hypothetical protein
MNTDSFLERWNRMGKQRQLLMVLMALQKQLKMIELSVPLTELDTIGTGESLLMIVNGDELVLRYSPEQTELLTIQENAPWTTGAPNPYAKSQTNSVLTDAAQAEAEKRQSRSQQVRQAAQRIRGNRGLENLTDDLPPLS